MLITTQPAKLFHRVNIAKKRGGVKNAKSGFLSEFGGYS